MVAAGVAPTAHAEDGGESIPAENPGESKGTLGPYSFLAGVETPVLWLAAEVLPSPRGARQQVQAAVIFLR